MISWLACAVVCGVAGGLFVVAGIAFAVSFGRARLVGTEHVVEGPVVAWPHGEHVVYANARIAARKLDSTNNPTNELLWTVEAGDADAMDGVSLADPFHNWRGRSSVSTLYTSWSDVPAAFVGGHTPVAAPRGVFVRSLSVQRGDTVTDMGDQLFIGTQAQARAAGMRRLRIVRGVSTGAVLVGGLLIGIAATVVAWMSV